MRGTAGKSSPSTGFDPCPCHDISTPTQPQTGDPVRLALPGRGLAGLRRTGPGGIAAASGASLARANRSDRTRPLHAVSADRHGATCGTLGACDGNPARWHGSPGEPLPCRRTRLDHAGRLRRSLAAAAPEPLSTLHRVRIPSRNRAAGGPRAPTRRKRSVIPTKESRTSQDMPPYRHFPPSRSWAEINHRAYGSKRRTRGKGDGLRRGPDSSRAPPRPVLLFTPSGDAHSPRTERRRRFFFVGKLELAEGLPVTPPQQ